MYTGLVQVTCFHIHLVDMHAAVCGDESTRTANCSHGSEDCFAMETDFLLVTSCTEPCLVPRDITTGTILSVHNPERQRDLAYQNWWCPLLATPAHLVSERARCDPACHGAGRAQPRPAAPPAGPPASPRPTALRSVSPASETGPRDATEAPCGAVTCGGGRSRHV